MKLKPMACGTWIDENDRKVLKVLREAETMPTAEEIAEKTGLHVGLVRCTLGMIAMQQKMVENRRKIFSED